MFQELHTSLFSRLLDTSFEPFVIDVDESLDAFILVFGKISSFVSRGIGFLPLVEICLLTKEFCGVLGVLFESF